MKHNDHHEDEFERMMAEFIKMLNSSPFGNRNTIGNDFTPDPNDIVTRKGRTPDGGYFEESTWTSPDGASTYSSVTYSSNPMTNQPTRMPKFETSNFEGNDIDAKVKQMEALLKPLVEKEDFENAAKLRDKIDYLKSIEPKFKKYKKQMMKAVSEEDYKKAQVYKDKIHKLLNPKK
jgi:hypothetical protein